MEISSPICLFFVMMCTLFCFGISQPGGGGSSLPCVQKLLPCQPYLKGSSAPPSSCCIPLKQIVADDSQCLCAVINDPAILKSLNITQDDALNLAKSCGANADTSACKNAAAPSSSSPSPSSPSAGSNSSPASTPDKQKGAANSLRISHVGRSLMMSLAIVSSFFIVSAF